MKILCEPVGWSAKIIPRLEKHYGARYICEMPLRVGGLWRDDPSLIFYVDVAHPEGSNWFAISRSGDDLVISNAADTVVWPITAIVADNGDVVYSHFRHDMHWSPDGSVFLDGGMDYKRTNRPDRLITLTIDKDELREQTRTENTPASQKL